ncbi:STAS/SEC14 domain-containing protein [Flavimaricola marinus]|uniref:SpoIIAA-like protein n=1 Tax=Flavimaricola marinus TaxID=1819565 RepID=A0A238LFH1_9RHOB|nr:STAS/SEC14 domain-containing protein [Flavimaricola marinus]SMY08323.1 hypothetical protein LOM8899_02474 [Flavimaricola marinus]
MPVTYVEDPETKTVEFTVDGHISREDYDKIVEPMQKFIDTHGKIKLVEVVKGFTGFDPTVILPGMFFDMRNIMHISHVAVVSDIAWFSPFIQAASAVSPIQMRSFTLAQIDAARRWAADPEAHQHDGPV